MPVPLLETPPLLSCWESVVYRECPGPDGSYCGDELDEDDREFCKPCQKELDKAEERARRRADGEEILVPYEYLTDGEFGEAELEEAIRNTEHLEYRSIEQMKQDAA